MEIDEELLIKIFSLESSFRLSTPQIAKLCGASTRLVIKWIERDYVRCAEQEGEGHSSKRKWTTREAFEAYLLSRLLGRLSKPTTVAMLNEWRENGWCYEGLTFHGEKPKEVTVTVGVGVILDNFVANLIEQGIVVIYNNNTEGKTV